MNKAVKLIFSFGLMTVSLASFAQAQSSNSLKSGVVGFDDHFQVTLDTKKITNPDITIHDTTGGIEVKSGSNYCVDNQSTCYFEIIAANSSSSSGTVMLRIGDPNAYCDVTMYDGAYVAEAQIKSITCYGGIHVSALNWDYHYDYSFSLEDN